MFGNELTTRTTAVHAWPTESQNARSVVVSPATSEQEWDAFVTAHPDASSYHAWRWRSVFERAFGHETVYLIAHRAGDVVGVLPLVLFRSWLFGRFAVSLPFVNYGGVVADDADAGRALLQRAVEIAKDGRLAHVELRHSSRQFADLACKQHKVGMVLSLPSTADDMWTKLDRKVRNQVRKAEKSGLVVESGGAELLREFYRVFAHNMRDLGTPVYSRRLFEEVFAQFPETSRVFLVQHQWITVAAGVTYRHRNIVEVPCASSLAAYRAMCPNNLLYWRVIEWAISERLQSLDFGRSTPGEGTFHFKRQWGAVPQPLYWEYALMAWDGVPDRSPKNPKFHRAIAIWKRLPVSIASTLGPKIVRWIP
jgi:FemAB-related protein (PEP-CTERM system-associated)